MIVLHIFQQVGTNYVAALIKEENDMEPVLFGGFSFDPKSVKESEWDAFPSAYFVVPSFQLTIKNGKTSISINLVTESDDAAEEFDKLRDERDRSNSYCASRGIRSTDKTRSCCQLRNLQKKIIMKTVADVTKKINKGEAEKVVIARSVKLNFDR